MTWSLTCSLALLLAANGCRFDGTVGTARVPCGPKGECPTDHVCATQLNLCRKKAPSGVELDVVPPVFTAKLSRTRVNRGSVVVLTLDANEPIAGLPVVSAQMGDGPRPLPREPGDPAGNRFVFTPLSTDVDQTIAFLVDAIDVAGNETRGQLLPVSLVLDNTAPTLLLDKSSILPSSARLFTTVSLRAVFNEAVQAGLSLRVTDAAGNLVKTLLPVSNLNGIVSFTYLVDAPDFESRFSFAVADVQDLADNAMTGSAALGILDVDTRAPKISALGLQGKKFSAQAGHNQVWVPIRLDDDAGTAIACLTVSGCQTGLRHGDDAGFVVTDTLSTDSPRVVVSATDAVGNQAQNRVEAVTFDFTAPNVVGTAAVTYGAPAGCPLLAGEVAAGTAQSRITVAFTVDDDAVDAGLLMASGLAFAREASASPKLSYSSTVPMGVTTAMPRSTVTLVDDVANFATRDVTTLVLDGVVPATPTAMQRSLALFSRAPWGNAESNGKPSFRVQAPAGTFEPHARLVFLNGSVPSTASTLGVARAGADGSLASWPLANVDVSEVFVRVFDSACNADALSASRLSRVEWYAAMGRKVPGSLIENPHVFVDQRSTDDTTLFAVNEVEEPTAMAARDDAGLRTTPFPQFFELNRGFSPSTPGARFAGALAYDALRQTTVLFGGVYQPGALFTSDEVWEWNGGTWAKIPTPGAKPSARWMHGMAFDQARRRVVVFGGESYVNSVSVTLNDTWGWNGAAWTKAQSAHSPSPRNFPSMAYDSQRARVVLFGGVDTSGSRADTWEWNGDDWANVTPDAGSPSPRSRPAMAYDSVRARTVLFGGFNGSTNVSDTWVWNGTAWNNVTPDAGSPPARSEAQATFDSTRGVVVLAGGLGAAGALADVWEWNGTTWALAPAPSGSPLARQSAAMAYDVARQESVLFGGLSTSAAGALNDTWTWNGSVWGNRSPTASQPTPRESVSLAYDPTRSRVVLFGGLDNTGARGDTWEFDGTAWANRSPAVISPAARRGAGLVHSASHGGVVLFGGRGPTMGMFADSWVWNGTAWTQLATPSAPSARYLHAMTYDKQNSRVVVSGGQDLSNNALGDTWALTGSNWSNVTPGGSSPSGRYLHAMAYDDARFRSVEFGGQSSGPIVGDTWEWLGASWASVTPMGTLPASRRGHAMAYNAGKSRVQMLGGYPADTALWEWNGSAWSTVGITGVIPDARQNHGLTYDTGRNRLVLFGGVRGQQQRTHALWEFDGGTWADRTPQVDFPTERTGATATYDVARDRVVLFGGYGNEGLLNDTWEWDGTSWSVRTPTGAKPTPRAYTSLAYDSANAKVMLFGGWSETGGTDDLWQWNGTTWTQVTANGATGSPGARNRQAMVYDKKRSRLVVYGGIYGGSFSGPYDDTWEWTGTAWSGRVPQGSAGSPPGRSLLGMAYDEVREKTVLFGGYDGTKFFSDTWEWNGTAWSRISTTTVGGELTARARHNLAYDANRKTVVTFGGQDGAGSLSDAWEFNGKVWSRVSGGGWTPEARTEAAAAYDATRKRLVVFGGAKFGGYYTDLLNDTFALGLTPSSRAAHSVRANLSSASLPPTASLVDLSVRWFAGGSGAGAPGAVLQRWNGSSWTTMASHSAPEGTSGVVEATLTDSAVVGPLVEAPFAAFRVTPVSQTTATVPATLSSDYVDVRLTYTLP